MRILITGATGFVGKYLLNELVNSKYELILLTRKNVIKIEASNISYINLTNSNWKELIHLAQPDVVLHLASYLTSSDDEESIKNLIDANLLFGSDLLNALSRTNIKYFINTGTFAEYNSNKSIPEPAYLYAATKTAFRSILKYYQSVIGFKTINIIPYTIYGGIDTNKKLIDIIYSSTESTDAIKMSPGEQVLDFIHIDDVVNFYKNLFINLHHFKNKYTEYHLGTGIGTTPRRIAEIIQKITGKRTQIEWGGLPYRTRDTMHSVALNKKSSSVFDWKPTINISEGIVKYLRQTDKIE